MSANGKSLLIKQEVFGPQMTSLGGTMVAKATGPAGWIRTKKDREVLSTVPTVRKDKAG